MAGVVSIAEGAINEPATFNCLETGVPTMRHYHLVLLTSAAMTFGAVGCEKSLEKERADVRAEQREAAEEIAEERKDVTEAAKEGRDAVVEERRDVEDAAAEGAEEIKDEQRDVQDAVKDQAP